MVTDTLFNTLKIKIKKTSYPNGIKPVPDSRIEETAFFPGGDGLYKHKNFEKSKIMILGQDFDNEENFKKAKNHRSEITMPKGNPTWTNLKKILETENKISMQKCFFTNAIMGLRTGDTKNTGRSKAFLKIEKNEKFLSDCRKFFIEQLKFQRPKLIIGLGAHIPKFLLATSDNLKGLSGITSLSKIGKSDKIEDRIEENLFKDVVFDGITGYKTNVIFITHPSLYYSNVGKRHERGKEFENELIAKAVSLL